MKWKIIIILTVGIVIIGGAISSTLIQIECKHCGGDGKIKCSDCEGSGAVIEDIYLVECVCGGTNSTCRVCLGKGGYYHYLIGVCKTCNGKGAEICPWCDGLGKVKLNEIVLKFFKVK